MTTSTATAVRPFQIHVPDEDLVDLRRRIAATSPAPPLRIDSRTHI